MKSHIRHHEQEFRFTGGETGKVIAYCGAAVKPERVNSSVHKANCRPCKQAYKNRT